MRGLGFSDNYILYQRSIYCVSPSLLSVDESSPSSQVWFLHCRVHSKLLLSSERCPLTRMRKPLSTLSLHSFLQLMEAPLVVRIEPLWNTFSKL